MVLKDTLKKIPELGSRCYTRPPSLPGDLRSIVEPVACRGSAECRQSRLSVCARLAARECVRERGGCAAPVRTLTHTHRHTQRQERHIGISEEAKHTQLRKKYSGVPGGGSLTPGPLQHGFGRTLRGTVTGGGVWGGGGRTASSSSPFLPRVAPSLLLPGLGSVTGGLSR